MPIKPISGYQPSNYENLPPEIAGDKQFVKRMMDQDVVFRASVPFHVEVSRFTSFELSESMRRLYEEICSVKNRRENLMWPDHLVKAPGEPDWMTRFWTALLNHTIEGYGATLYHYERLAEIEQQIVRAADSLKDIPVGYSTSYMGGGNLRVFEYEYQAYLMAYRRTLEYLAQAICSYFKVEGKRIRGVEKKIKDCEPRQVCERLVAVLDTHLKAMVDFLPKKGDPDSKRDELAHGKPVKLGERNIRYGETDIEIFFAPTMESYEKLPESRMIYQGARKVMVCHIVNDHVKLQMDRLENLIRAVAEVLVLEAEVDLYYGLGRAH
jgi:hypothetical protein